MPKQRHASVNNAIERSGSLTSTTGTRIVAPVRPRPANDFRTRVGDSPRAIRRSLSHPERIQLSEMATKGNHPNSAIFVFGKYRSFSRYAGSHVIRKYQ